MKKTEESKPEYIEIDFKKEHDEVDDEVNNGEIYSRKK
jgi:hypothetical protein